MYYGIDEVMARYEAKKYFFPSSKSRNKESHVVFSLRKPRKKKQKI